MQLSLINLILFILASSIGAGTRFIIGNTITPINSNFPLNTLIINLCGSCLIGLVWAASQHYHGSETFKFIVIAGFLGSFTTFSTFSLDSFKLIELNHYKHLTLYLTSSVFGGILLTMVGLQIGKLVFR